MVFDAPSRWIRACAIQAVLLIAITAVDHPNDNRPSRQRRGRAGSFDRCRHSRVDRRSRQAARGRSGVWSRRSRGRTGLSMSSRARCGHGVRACLMMSVTPAAELSDPSDSDRHAPETAGSHGVDRSRAPARDRGAGESRARGRGHASTCSTHRGASGGRRPTVRNRRAAIEAGLQLVAELRVGSDRQRVRSSNDGSP